MKTLTQFNKEANHKLLVEEINQYNDTGVSSEDLATITESVQADNFVQEFDVSTPEGHKSMMDWIYEGFGMVNDESYLDEEYLNEENIITEASKKKKVSDEPEVQETPKPKRVIFRFADIYQDTVDKYKDKKQIPKAFGRFSIAKIINPHQKAAGKDDPLTGPGSPLKKLGVWHSPMTDDIKVFYRVEPHPKVRGATAINIYGHYSHDDAGTAPGKAANYKKQENLAKRIKNVDDNDRFEDKEFDLEQLKKQMGVD